MAYPNQKFYISYHKALDENDNKYYHTWPFQDIVKKDGLMIWHKQGTSNYTGNYEDWRKAPIDIEAAHGKYIWTTYTDSVHNTYVANALTGRDSLEIRKTIPIYNPGTGYYDDTEIQGPYYTKDHGSASVFYTPDVSQDFTAFTNPNSNFIVNSSTESFAQNIVSGFSVKNLRTVNNKVYVDFAINDFTVSENTTLAKGKWRIENDITVASGITLTIQEGTELLFKNGASLIVNGTLNAVGTSSNKITFNFVNKGSYNGIKFHNGSTGTVRYCNIENAYYGINIGSGNASPTIQYCNISDNNYGIYFSLDSYNVSSISFNTIDNNTYDGIYVDVGGPLQTINQNTITNSGRYGIYCYGRDPDITSNVISDNSTAGIYLYYYSAPDIYNNSSISDNGIGIKSYRSQPFIGSNLIEDNSTAIFGTSSSNVTIFDNLIRNGTIGLKADYSSTLSASYCSIYGYTGGGDYTLWANHSSTIYTTNNNCFDTDEPSRYTANGSIIYWQFSQPCGGMSKIASFGENTGTPSVEMPSSPNNDSYDKELELAFRNIIDKKYEDAIAIYTRKFQRENDIYLKKFILSQLAFCYKKARRDDFIIFLNNEIRISGNNRISPKNELYALTIELENSFLFKERNYDTVLENLEFLKSNFSENDEIYKNALFGLIHLNYSYNKDTSLAKNYLDELNNKYPTDELTLNALLLLEETEKYRLLKQSIENQTHQGELLTTKDDIPGKFALYENYPNPFNPTTQISYQIPKDGLVNLVVYNALGQKVSQLINKHQSMGKYSVKFNANNLPSGVYIYKLRVGEFSSVKKMMLIK